MTRKTLALTLMLALTAPAFAQHEEKDIVDTAIAAGSFNTLARALTEAGLVDALRGDGPFTVFAPTDAAFAKLPEGALQKLLRPANKGRLSAILTYHVAPGRIPAEKVVGMGGVATLNGQRADLSVQEGDVRIDGARIVKTDIHCSNGIIHVIDGVIMPASDDLLTTAKKSGGFKTLTAAIKAAGLAEALGGKGPFTVFAPTDEAFAKLPEGTLASLLKEENRGKLASILKYHVVSGRVHSPEALAAGKAKTLLGKPVRIAVEDGVARVNQARLTATDIDCSNAVIHVVDTVLLPPSDGAKAKPASSSGKTRGGS